MDTIGTPVLWIAFLVGMFLMLGVDLFANRKPKKIEPKEATIWTVIWVSIAIAFGIFIYLEFGSEKAIQFGTAYLLEEALSVDNLFVFLIVFASFRVPENVQHRVLFWGIAGAVLMRGGFILAGTALIQSFNWVMYILGAILVITAVRMLLSKDDDEPDLEKNIFLRLTRRIVPMTPDYRGQHFFVREDRWKATPLFAVVVVVETTDLVFAVDSVPAALAVSDDPYIVFTSNMLAILGLRTLFFLLSAMMGKLQYLKHGLGLVLLFIGVKLCIHHWVPIDEKISLLVVAVLIGGATVLSLMSAPKDVKLPHSDDKKPDPGPTTDESPP